MMHLLCLQPVGAANESADANGAASDHADAAACLAEHQWPLEGGDVIALTLDGIGMGENGALWGGECLRRTIANVSTWAACLQWRFRGAIWRRSSRAEPAGAVPALCAGVAELPLKRQVCNSKTGAYWRGPLSVELTRRWRHRVGGCSMQWRRHWAVRQPRW